MGLGDRCNMTTEHSNQPDHETPDTRLVEYLDGELDQAARHEIDGQLAQDATVREEVHGLQQAWELLDYLPRAETDDSFTDTTLEMVAAKASEEMAVVQGRWTNSNWFRWLRRGGAIAAAFLTGYFAISMLNDRARNDQLDQMPLIEQFDVYDYGDSIAFLRKLNESKIFESNEMNHGDSWEEKFIFDDLDREAIRSQVEELTPTDKKQLQDNKKRFEQLPSEKRDRIESFYDAFRKAEDHEPLRSVVSQYYAWMTTLAASDRAEVYDLPADQRIERIRELRQREERRRLALFSEQLKTSDAEQIRNWFFGEFMRSHKSELDSRTPEELRSSSRRRRGWSAMRRRMKWVFDNWASGDSLPLPSHEEIGGLKSRLSDELQAELEAKEDLASRQLFVLGLVQAAHRSRDVVDDDRLLEFYNELSDQERDELEKDGSGSREEFFRALRSHYYRHHRGTRDGRPREGGMERGGRPFGPPRYGGRGGFRPRRDGPGGRRPDDRPPRPPKGSRRPPLEESPNGAGNEGGSPEGERGGEK